MNAVQEIAIGETTSRSHAMTSVLLSDARWIGPHGIGRFAQEILSRLPGHTLLQSGPKVFSPADPFWLTYQVLAGGLASSFLRDLIRPSFVQLHSCSQSMT